MAQKRPTVSPISSQAGSVLFSSTSYKISHTRRAKAKKTEKLCHDFILLFSSHRQLEAVIAQRDEAVAELATLRAQVAQWMISQEHINHDQIDPSYALQGPPDTSDASRSSSSSFFEDPRSLSASFEAPLVLNKAELASTFQADDEEEEFKEEELKEEEEEREDEATPHGAQSAVAHQTQNLQSSSKNDAKNEAQSNGAMRRAQTKAPTAPKRTSSDRTSSSRASSGSGRTSFASSSGPISSEGLTMIASKSRQQQEYPPGLRSNHEERKGQCRSPSPVHAHDPSMT